MKRPTITIHDLAMDSIEVREMNDQEFAQYEKDLLDQQEREAKEAAIQAARQDLLNKLGITEEEAKLLLG